MVQAKMMAKNILVLGATGLVGEHVVNALVEDPLINSIHCLVRSHQRHQSQKVQCHWVDFMNLDAHDVLFDGITDVICCIGTTMKKAKSRGSFSWWIIIFQKKLHVLQNQKALDLSCSYLVGGQTYRHVFFT